MSKFGVLKDAYLSVHGVDLSNHVSRLQYQQSAAEIASHAMGDDYEYSKPGLFRVTCTATFFQDFAAASVDATLDPLWRNRTEFEVKMRANKTLAVSTTNPMYSGQAFISSYRPIGGAHGENLMAEVTFSPASDWQRVTA
jgi:hypothetical protein